LNYFPVLVFYVSLEFTVLVGEERGGEGETGQEIFIVFKTACRLWAKIPMKAVTKFGISFCKLVT
jgi:hypothetical protein